MNIYTHAADSIGVQTWIKTREPELIRRGIFANLSVRVPPDILETLHKLKMTTGKSLNQLVVEALRQYIAEQADKGERSRP